MVKCPCILKYNETEAIVTTIQVKQLYNKIMFASETTYITSIEMNQTRNGRKYIDLLSILFVYF